MAIAHAALTMLRLNNVHAVGTPANQSLNRARNLIERFFNKIKHCRCVAALMTRVSRLEVHL